MVYNDDETRKGILKGQCINIAFQNFDYKSDVKELKERVRKAHEIYNELMLDKILIW